MTAVEAAQAGVDAHAESLTNHPEWQQIQTVRGALRHVWDVMKEKAGPYWEKLREDVRFQGFWKTMSIRAREAISVKAAALANRLRPGTGDLPAADALLKLSDATLTYSKVAAAEPANTPVPVSPPEADAEAPPMQRLVERKSPTAYATREDSVRAAEEVTRSFAAWMGTSMGQDLNTSDHRRVTAFRDAWQQLPPHDSGPGPAVGPYGDVAERANALVTAAVASARFAPGDLRALQAVAQAADHHAARLSITLPPGTQPPTTQKAALPAPRAAPHAAGSPHPWRIGVGGGAGRPGWSAATRSCGEQTPAIRARRSLMGSSPRVRGAGLLSCEDVWPSCHSEALLLNPAYRVNGAFRRRASRLGALG
ncbi:hypothetical protein ABT246_39195 [Streptomyces sp. NPDC001553]|uniref:hypothetical protein n=1 Tax=Streptomyces sp. NPDC001553 TaxID=3154385 RepID=UPI0033278D9F